MVSSARHQPPTAVIAHQTTAADIRGGYGCCFECVRKADEDGEVPVDRGPGVCGFDCVVCDCDCRSVFMEHNRQKISTGVEREKKRLEEVKKSGKTTSVNPIFDLAKFI